tara:strand:- start:1 stop:624 length:624 start_codon:yes stop_codon:yes gene_type:complete
MLKKFHTENLKEVGIDEAGRGCLFGPVCVASVSLNMDGNPLISEIKDSKKLSQKKRDILYDIIKENSIYSIQLINEEVIDKENILQATLKGMHLSLDELDMNTNIDLILVDGNHFPPYFSITQDKFLKHECVINGDNTYVNIAAASILAKVTRDRYIIDLCEKNENLKKYDLHKNKGYGTKKHMEAIKEFGIVEGHRKSFKPCSNYV